MLKRNITEAAVEVHQRDQQQHFKVLFRKNFTVDAVGYFQEVGDRGKNW